MRLDYEDTSTRPVMQVNQSIRTIFQKQNEFCVSRNAISFSVFLGANIQMNKKFGDRLHLPSYCQVFCFRKARDARPLCIKLGSFGILETFYLDIRLVVGSGSSAYYGASLR